MKKHFKLFATILVVAIFTPIIGYAYCPLGDDVTKDLVGILRIMKILAPLLVIIYSTYEAVLAITQGKIEEEGRKLFNKFARRVGAALLLFVIPVIVDQLMQLMDVWDDEGHCVLETVQVQGAQTGNEECLKNCDKILDAQGQKACKEKCSASGEAGTNNGNSVQTSVTNNSQNVATSSTNNANNVSTSVTNNTHSVQAGSVDPNTPNVGTTKPGDQPPVVVIN